MKYNVTGDKFVELIDAQSIDEAWEITQKKRKLKNYHIASSGNIVGKPAKIFCNYEDGQGRILSVKIREL